MVPSATNADDCHSLWNYSCLFRCLYIQEGCKDETKTLGGRGFLLDGVSHLILFYFYFFLSRSTSFHKYPIAKQREHPGNEKR